LTITDVCDPDAVPDLPALVQALQGELDALIAMPASCPVRLPRLAVAPPDWRWRRLVEQRGKRCQPDEEGEQHRFDPDCDEQEPLPAPTTARPRGARCGRRRR
jgi:hypothetical protein